MTTITIERELLEQALDAIQELEHASTAVSDKKARDAKQSIRAALAAPATAPAWHDAPTCAGLWLCDEGDENPYRFTCHDISMPLNPHLVGEGERWYGPIPKDKS